MVFDTKRMVTCRERFLTEMDAVIPWAPLLARIAPRFAKAGRGRSPLPLAMMLRVYFLRQWFTRAHPKSEDMLYGSESMRRSVSVFF